MTQKIILHTLLKFVLSEFSADDNLKKILSDLLTSELYRIKETTKNDGRGINQDDINFLFPIGLYKQTYTYKWIGYIF